MRGGYGGLPGLRRGSPVVIVNEVALGVGPLGPGPEGLVVRAPDAGPDGDSQPRDAHRAQAVDVDSAGELAGEGVPGNGLQEAVVALADGAAVVGGGEGGIDRHVAVG